MEELGTDLELKVYSTDIDRDALNLARTGLYPSSIAAEDVSPERLTQFFDKKDSYYQVKKEIRSKVLFSERDYLSRAPFTGIDLVSPRSIAIYLNSASQKMLVPLLYDVLNPGGILFMGTPDTVHQFSNMFTTLDSRWKIYERKW